MVPLIVSFYFGLPHFGLNYGITATAPALGSLAFGMIFRYTASFSFFSSHFVFLGSMAGLIYDQQVGLPPSVFR